MFQIYAQTAQDPEGISVVVKWSLQEQSMPLERYFEVLVLFMTLFIAFQQ